MRLLILLALGCGSATPHASNTGDEQPVAAAEVDPSVSSDSEAEAEPDSEADPGSDAVVHDDEPRPTATHVPDDLALPLSDDAMRLLSALPTETITAPDEFYYRSNERRHDLVAPSLQGLGGAVIGVGADQLYTLAAMADASLIVAVDYDRRIPLMHALYQVLVPRSETVQALLAHFDEDNERATIALLEAELPELVKRKVLRIYRRIRGQMAVYLSRVARRIRDGRPASWLADPELYAHVRALFVNGRVVSRTGDLTGTTTLRSVGETLTTLGVPVRVVYFSNAEQFFEYTEDFRANMAALSADDRTLVVRTIRHTDIPNADGGNWHYVLQPFSDFRARIDTGAYPRSTLLLEDLLHAEPDFGAGVSRLNADVPQWVLERRRRRD